MRAGGGYPAGDGKTEIHVFGKDEEEKRELEVYSVKSDGKEVRHSREGLAVLEIVRRELQSKHFDLKSGGYVDTQAGDICILTRKRNKSAAEIVRALTDAGYGVSGAQEADITSRPEVRQMLDILSYIDQRAAGHTAYHRASISDRRAFLRRACDNPHYREKRKASVQRLL